MGVVSKPMDKIMKHFCESNERYNFECYEWEDGNLYLAVEGEYGTMVRFCPFCGFRSKKRGTIMEWSLFIQCMVIMIFVFFITQGTPKNEK